MKNLIYIFLSIFVFSNCKKQVIDPIKPPTVDSTIIVKNFEIPKLKDMVMYEVNIRCFSAEGNFAGIVKRLDNIKSLGVNVLWLMPIHPVGKIKSVGQLGSPYSVQNYLEVNPEFGSLADFKTLVAEAHKRNMAVIIDWVANHTAWDNPWLANKNWYSQDAAGNVTIPAGTNWQDVADLNFGNAEMRLEMIKSMKYWAKYVKIDGFRCDAADFVPFDFWKQALDSLKNIPNRNLIMLAEGNRKDHFAAGFQLNYSWDFYNQLKKIYTKNTIASNLSFVQNSEYTNIGTTGQKLRFTTNHDESAWDATPMYLFGGKDGSLSAFVLCTFMGGVPLIYSSQEVGRYGTLPFFSRSAINWNENKDIETEYIRLMKIRTSSEAFKQGTLEALESDPNVTGFIRKYQNDEYLILVNTRDQVIDYDLPTNIANTNWLNTSDNSNLKLGTVLNLQPYQYYILKK